MVVCNSGNLLNRTLGLLRKNCQSTLVVDSAIAAEGTAFRDNVEKLVSLLNFNAMFHPLCSTTFFTFVLEQDNLMGSTICLAFICFLCQHVR